MSGQEAGNIRFVQQIWNSKLQLFGGFESTIYILKKESVSSELKIISKPFSSL